MWKVFNKVINISSSIIDVNDGIYKLYISFYVFYYLQNI
jgi:hypothetical protein